MKRKIFIGIDLSEEVKRRLMQKIDKWKEFPIRWSREENLHLSLSSLGHIDDELIYSVCDGVKEAVKNMEAFDVALNKIELGPTQDENAKVAWFSGEESAELKNLSENIEKELGIFRDSKKIFKPHIILGRVQKYGWQKLKEKPDIAEDFSILLPVESVQIFESRLLDGKRKFSVIDNGELNV